MPGRRSALRWGLGLAGTAGAFGGGATWIARRRDGAAFDALAAETWRGPDAAATPILRGLLRCATLAPNSHNTQPWRFIAARGWLRVLPDLARRTPVVDPDDHHLFASLGCAVETMVQAGPALGLQVEVETLADGSASLHLLPRQRQESAMAAAIARRRCRQPTSRYWPRRAARMRASASCW